MSTGFQLLLSLANTAVWFCILPISQILLPLQVAALDSTHKFINLAIATSVGVLVAPLTNPIAGACSDRTTSRLGRRRPWLIIGTVLSAITLALMAQASSFVTLVVWWAIFHIAANALLAALAAVVPDRVPVHQRATVSALVSLSLPLGAVIGVPACHACRPLNAAGLHHLYRCAARRHGPPGAGAPGYPAAE